MASSSPRRLALLRQLGVAPLVWPAATEEYRELTPDRDPRALVIANAELKARAVAEEFPQALVIGADTVVFLDGELLGKPAGAEEARGMLRRLSGRAHQVYTGICLADTGQGRVVSGADRAEVWFQELAETEIDAYVKSGAPLDKAGAYGVQDGGGWFVRRIEGDYTTVVGLSFALLRTLLRQLRP